MPSSMYDLIYLQAGLLDLEGYLLSNELYWPVGAQPPAGQPPYPRVTLGNLLLSHKRLESQDLDSNQQAEFRRLSERLENSRSQWRVAWGTKARREFSSRLSLWRDFLEDYRRKPQANIDRYDYEVSRRVLLELLLKDAEGIPPQEIELLSSLDGMLKAVFLPGKFIWEEEQAGGFPKEPYWYLYGRPKAEPAGGG
jgi:hypothetical protein